MKSNKIISFIILFAGLAVPLVSHGMTATEIIEKADKMYRGVTSYAEITMKIVKPEWSREISMKSWSKGSDYSLILITAPARDKGTAFLMRDNEVWNWIPSIERVIKIPPSMMMQSWMGSDFTNDDLVKESSIVIDYTHELLSDSVIDGRECYEIALYPKEEAAVVWGKMIVWITKTDFMQLRIEYYDEDGKLINVMTASEIKTMSGRPFPTYWEMVPVDKPGNVTILTYFVIEFDKPIKDSFFSEQNMKRIR